MLRLRRAMPVAPILRALALVAWLPLTGTAFAQLNASTNLIDSPMKMRRGVQSAGETLICSVALGPPEIALFGTDTLDPTADPVEFLTGEIEPPFRIFRTDEACNLRGSWSTALTGTATMTGVAADRDPNFYWVVSVDGMKIEQFQTGIGNPTGRSCPLPPGFGPYGPLVVDSNETDLDAIYVQDITTDVVFGIDLLSCQVFCAFSNPDRQGTMGAFGNGLGDAASPDECGGATLVVSSGLATEGRVVRVGQLDCSQTFCPDTWDLRVVASSMINGIDEFTPSGAFLGPGTTAIEYIVVVDNLTGEQKIICRPAGLADCQGRDAATDVLFVNSSRGGPDYTVEIPPAGGLSSSMTRIAGANGKFVFHLDAGAPGLGSVTPLLDLGDSCFPFLDPTSSIVANNAGKTDRVGPSSYFGVPRPDPAKAPSFFDPTQPVIDLANLPSGSQWTGQAVALNPASSSKRSASLTNAVLYSIQ